jgi:hypothetical protein
MSSSTLFIKAMKKELSKPDASLFDDPAFQETAINDIKEAYKNGVEGQINDIKLLMNRKSWGFDFKSIAAPIYSERG